MLFGSDNWAGASPKVMQALQDSAWATLPAYGNDPVTAGLTARLSEVFEHPVSVFLVTTGTAANALSVAAAAPPWGAVLAHTEGHLGVDECGAPEFFAGTKVIGLPGPRGKIAPQTLVDALADLPAGVVHHVQPSVLSLTNATELGTLYSPDETATLAAIAHGRNMTVHLDGARLANAVAASNWTPAELTWKSGVDMLSFGATKGGCLIAEAIVLFDDRFNEALAFRRKRAGQLVSKQRFMAAQFTAWLDDGHWLDLAAHANRMAASLAEGLEASGKARLPWRPETNEVFASLPIATAVKLQKAGAAFYDWPARTFPDLAQRRDEAVYRFVTSFATTEEDVATFLGHLAQT